LRWELEVISLPQDKAGPAKKKETSDLSKCPRIMTKSYRVDIDMAKICIIDTKSPPDCLCCLADCSGNLQDRFSQLLNFFKLRLSHCRCL
jgi:hypothetical protein